MPVPMPIVGGVIEVVEVEVEVEVDVEVVVEVVVEVKVEVEVDVVEVGVEGSDEPEASSLLSSSLDVQAIAALRIKARVVIRSSEKVISSPLKRVENAFCCAIRLPMRIFESED
ncbi:MAG: hypothetical protein ACXWC9_05895 [Pseudobdellovibrionaceae bacterium]